jgi:hypothetical protein
MRVESADVPVPEPSNTCDLGVTHTGPFVTLTALAVLRGLGTRRKNQKRRVARKILGRFCLDCAKGLEFRVGTAEFRSLGHELINPEKSHGIYGSSRSEEGIPSFNHATDDAAPRPVLAGARR